MGETVTVGVANTKKGKFKSQLEFEISFIAFKTGFFVRFIKDVRDENLRYLQFFR